MKRFGLYFGAIKHMPHSAVAEKIFTQSRPSFSDAIGNGGNGPVMVDIPSGTFEMGCNTGEFEERPAHTVTIQRFALGKYPVTFAEYDFYAEQTGVLKPDDCNWGRGTRPVINVSWEDAKKYTVWLSKQTGQRYRLPSEAEWEYACRAGSLTNWTCGNNEIDLLSHAWFYFNSQGRTHPVGKKMPNGFCLYDMHGNIWEWVEDSWNSNYNNAPADGTPNLQGNLTRRILRGGSWNDHAKELRSSVRVRNIYSDRNFNDGGFRVARDIP